jgi:hypothetical protein
MTYLRWLLLLACLVAGSLFSSPSQAQNVNLNCWNPTGSGLTQWVPCNSVTPLQIAGTFSATLGGFAPNGNYANLTSAGTSGSVALPAGAVVLISNTGTTTVSCTLGVGSATALANEIQVPASSSVSVTVGSNTFGACIDQTGSTSNTVVLAGGAGLFTGFGGGGGGSGGGGAITAASGSYASGALSSGSVASGAFASGSIASGAYASGSIGSGAVASGAISSGAVASGAVASGALAVGSGTDGWNVTDGAKADAACGTSNGTCSLIALLKYNNAQAASIVTNTGSAIPAGSAIIGKVGIDQTTPGTTNGAAIVGVNAATALAGAGATGTGALRVTAAQDTTTIAGSAPGTAGSASSNVVTVQGVASMTPVLVTPAAGSTVQGAVNVTPTDCSGTITAGGTAQNAIAATATIHGFTIANIDAATGSGEPLWISFTTTAAASTVASYPLSAPTATTFTGLSSYSSPLGFGLNHALSIIGATTAHKFSCTYW